MLDASGCVKYLEEVREFAKIKGLTKNFEEKLNYLRTYACTLENDVVDLMLTKCILDKDWSPNSFRFTMQRRDQNGDYQTWFNGGLIFYDAGDTGVDKQLSVRTGCTKKSEWNIHT